MRNDRPPFVARTIHRFSVLIILGWFAIIVILGMSVPPLAAGRERAFSLAESPDSPAFTAMTRVNEDFKLVTDSVVMIVLEGSQSLGDEAHRYYDGLIRQLQDDPKHVQHIQNFWGDPLTANAAQSADGKAVYVQLDLAGKPGETSGNDSVAAVRHIVRQTPPPPGIQVFVTGPAAIITDMGQSGDRTVIMMTVVSLAVIFAMLLLVFRSVVTVILLLLMVGNRIAGGPRNCRVARPSRIYGLTTFAVNLVVALGIAAGTDYGIFFIGRYQEARQAGEIEKRLSTPPTERSPMLSWPPV